MNAAGSPWSWLVSRFHSVLGPSSLSPLWQTWVETPNHDRNSWLPTTVALDGTRDEFGLGLRISDGIADARGDDPALEFLIGGAKSWLPAQPFTKANQRCGLVRLLCHHVHVEKVSLGTPQDRSDAHGSLFRKGIACGLPLEPHVGQDV